MRGGSGAYKDGETAHIRRMRQEDAGAAPVLLWLHRELRLRDNAALMAAVESGRPVLPVFVLDTESAGRWAPGGAQRWWLHHSLISLGANRATRGAPLLLRRGAFAEMIPALVSETGAVEVHAGQPIEPWARRAMEAVRGAIGDKLHLHRTTTLFGPDEIRTRLGGPFSVYTAFARACRARGVPPDTAPAPRRIATARPPRGDSLESWGLLPTRPDWAGGLRTTWVAGEAAAAKRLAHVAAQIVPRYDETRNFPGIDGTSMLSPHLHWGEISPLQAWHATSASFGAAETGNSNPGVAAFQNELLWREFSRNLLWHHPDLPEEPLRREFDEMPWRTDRGALLAWQRGLTGLPIVDAGMRQLWSTGWMHNRVRMIVASFLVKHLLIPWQEGEAWFWDTLVDADLASNAAQWQWVAGCGADAAPFFRIFNPVLQGKKFDPAGTYVRRFVPELAEVPDHFIHTPWEAPSPPRNYAAPIIDLAWGRARALTAYQQLPRAA
jgi:deoxyribodipyrimidine photo-lyase